MKLLLLLILFGFSTQAHNQWHVKPTADNHAKAGDGKSVATAWSLQQALYNNPSVKPGDVIWLHGGVYKGHFICNLKGTDYGKGEIRIASFPGEWAVIDGNILNDAKFVLPAGGANPRSNILEVMSEFVRYDNFEISCRGEFIRFRDKFCADNGFHEYCGIYHQAATSNKFTNLVLRNIPGVAFASWKMTKDTEIYGCIFYYNGFIINDGKRRKCSEKLTTANTQGYENCIYTQNAGDLTRVFENNIFHNNYQSGIALWSAEYKATHNYMKNFRISDNVFINNGSPVRDETANLVVKTQDTTGKNRPENIEISNNVFYVNSRSSHNSGMDILNSSKDITITNNFIFKGTHGPVFNRPSDGITFRDNFYWGKRLFIGISPQDFRKGKWDMDNNTYYSWVSNFYEKSTKARHAFSKGAKDPQSFQALYNADRNSNFARLKLAESKDCFEPSGNKKIEPIVVITRNRYNPNRFHVTVFNPDPDGAKSAVEVDLSKFGITLNTPFTVRDVQDYFATPLISGRFSGKINFPMELTKIERMLPLKATAFVPEDSHPPHSAEDLNTFVVEFSQP